MNMKTIEGLVGARANIDLSDTAMGVYQQARQKGDTATAERALGYAGDMVNQAEAYEAKADEGMKADAKELEEKAKADQEKIIEKRKEDRKEDRKELEARIEQSRTPDSDTVEISGEGKAVSTETQAPESTEAAGTAADPAELPPVVYTSAGEVLSQEVTAEAELSVLA